MGWAGAIPGNGVRLCGSASARSLLPVRLSLKGGRPPRSDRHMLGAILYMLRTGIQWNALPREHDGVGPLSPVGR
jgi:hypothetical protein